MMNALGRLVTIAGASVLITAGSLRAQDRGGPARPDSAAQRKAILADREAIWRAWFTNDRPQLELLLPASVIAINNGDTTWQDRSAALAGATQFARDGGKLIRVAFPRTEIQVFGDVAILYSVYELEIEQSGKRSFQRGRATEVVILRAGRWRNAGWHLDSGR